MRCQHPESLPQEVEAFTPEWAKATMENDVNEVNKADIIVGYKRDRIFRPLSNPYSDFPVPSLLF